MATKPAQSRDYAQTALQYAREAAKDKKGRRFCKWTRLAAQRHLSDLKKREWDYVFDEWHAGDVCGFIEKLPHIEGVWDTPHLHLEAAQVFILAVVFGWRHKETRARRFTRVYVEMARKNAKSTLTAGVALYCLACEDEIGPQVIVGATTGAQAQKVFHPAKRMVEKTPALQEWFGLQPWARSITCGENGGFMQPINAKAASQDGWNPHLAVLDELHAHKDRFLFDVLRSAFGARKNPLLWSITTAGYNTDGVCYEQRTLATKVLEGVVEADHFFGVIYTLDVEDIEQGREFDPEVWPKANPLFGVAVQADEFRGFAKEAKASQDSAYEFRTKRLNIWTTAKGAWLNGEVWKGCDGPVDLEELEGVPCWGGMDLASTSDLCAVQLVWEVGDRYKTHGWYFVPEAVVRPRTEKANIPYLRWVESGELIATPGNVTDYAFIRRAVVEAMERFDIQALGYDPWNATHLTTELMEDGAPLVEFRQGPKSFNPPMKHFERMYAARMIDHGGNGPLVWMGSNVVARRDVNENMAPDKKHSHEKIDGMVALLMALGLKLDGVVAKDPISVYEERGILVI